MLLELNFHSRNRPFTMKKAMYAAREKLSSSASAQTQSVAASASFRRESFASHQTNSISA
jgi:hypothetical protein